jgi:hypothetical protein
MGRKMDEINKKDRIYLAIGSFLLIFGLCICFMNGAGAAKAAPSLSNMTTVVQNGYKAVTKYSGNVVKNAAESTLQQQATNAVINPSGTFTLDNAANVVQNTVDAYVPYKSGDTWNLGPVTNIYNNSMQTHYDRSSLNLLNNSSANYNTMSAFIPGGNKVVGNVGLASNITQAVMDDSRVQNYANTNKDSVGFHAALDVPDALTDSANRAAYDGASIVDKTFSTYRPDSYFGNDKNPIQGIGEMGYDISTLPAKTAINTGNNVKNAIDNINDAIARESEVGTDPNSEDFMQTSRFSRFVHAKDWDDIWAAINPFSDPRKKKNLDASNKTKRSNADISKKPNIYLYGEEGLEVTVRFGDVSRLTAADPDYPKDGWNVILSGNGRLFVQDSTEFALSGQYGLGGDKAAPDGTLGYLFYESVADSALFQYNEAWEVKTTDRKAALYGILSAYGFNETECLDFADFWVEYLDKDTEYLFYPQLTEAVNVQMPLVVKPVPEHVFRLWFAVKEADEGLSYTTPVITEKASHEGYALTEWGIVFTD